MRHQALLAEANKINYGDGLPGQSLIEMRGVGKQFRSPTGTTTVLRDINLRVDRGEYVVIAGKSGSGKSTLLNMLTGIDHPSEGTATINSTDIHALDESSLAQWRGKNIGIVFQFFQLVPTLSIRENIMLAMDFAGIIPKNKWHDRTESLLAQVGILQHTDKLPAALSGGEQQRAAIARALANDPSILVADEPTGNLDSRTALAIQSLFTQMVNSGKTVIVVTHENNPDAGYHRKITLADGAIAGDTKLLSVQEGSSHGY